MIKDFFISSIFMYGSYTLLIRSHNLNPLIKKGSEELINNFYYNLTSSYLISTCGYIGWTFGMTKMVLLIENLKLLYSKKK